MDNVVFDTFARFRNMDPPETPVTLSPIVISSDILVASPFTSEAGILSSQFQLTDTEGGWQSSITDEIRHWENIYGDSGSPNYIPTDLNENIDLSRLYVANLQSETTYWWRVRYRDQNLHWGEWSEPAEFTFGEVIDNADFTADVTEGTGSFEVRFTDLSVGNVTNREWDLNGDGETDSILLDPIFIYSEAGSYTVTLTATIDGEQYTETKIDFITVFGEDPPAPPENVQIEIIYPDAIISWTAVDTTITGEPIIPDGYNVYYSENENDYYFLGSTIETYFNHKDIALDNPKMFYRVRAYVDLSRRKIEYLDNPHKK